MKALKTLESRLVPLVHDDIDTDQIVPARFLKVTDKVGLREALFADWCKGPDGKPRPDFPLLQPEAQGAEVLLVGNNFGCGSSREHAPWALADFGFRVLIGLSFADIFKGNAMKNGILPIALEPKAHERLVQARQANPNATVRVDLPAQEVTLPDGSVCPFQVDSFAKHCLVEGVDELGYLLTFDAAIQAHEARTA
jgi:3-isopropylmalate/(R)-2-methylmalate dehydratase small subunit